MHPSAQTRRFGVLVALAAATLLLPVDLAAAAPPPPPPTAEITRESGPPPLSEEYIERETTAGRADLPAYLRAYPSCITAQPLIVAYNPLRDAIIPTTNSGTANCVLGVGNQGYAVRELQKALNACRGAGLTVDGIYGSATKTAVKNVQTAFGITADGVYGPVTRSKPIFPALPPYGGCFGFSY